MGKYELTIVMDGKTSPAKRKATQSTLEKIINATGGKVVETKEWGEKPLSYKIGKSETGYFVHFILELESPAVKAINLKLKMEEEIIRHLFIRI
jgi:small subunit ribosomal protein S6